MNFHVGSWGGGGVTFNFDFPAGRGGGHVSIVPMK